MPKEALHSSGALSYRLFYSWQKITAAQPALVKGFIFLSLFALFAAVSLKYIVTGECSWKIGFQKANMATGWQAFSRAEEFPLFFCKVQFLIEAVWDDNKEFIFILYATFSSNSTSKALKAASK